VFPLAVFDVVPNLVEVVREILESDSTGRYFMHYDAEKARRHWSIPPQIPTLSTAYTDAGRWRPTGQQGLRSPG
jgi:hypothetical protein